MGEMGRGFRATAGSMHVGYAEHDWACRCRRERKICGKEVLEQAFSSADPTSIGARVHDGDDDTTLLHLGNTLDTACCPASIMQCI